MDELFNLCSEYASTDPETFSNSGSASTDPENPWRGEFPILGRSTYLINNSLGAMPPRRLRFAAQFMPMLGPNVGVRAWEDSWWDLARTVADQISPLIGALPG